jgi:hypothetical protein
MRILEDLLIAPLEEIAAERMRLTASDVPPPFDSASSLCLVTFSPQRD